MQHLVKSASIGVLFCIADLRMYYFLREINLTKNDLGFIFFTTIQTGIRHTNQKGFNKKTARLLFLFKSNIF